MDCLPIVSNLQNVDVALLLTEENDNTSIDNSDNYLTRKVSPNAKFENSLFRVIKSTIEEEEKEEPNTTFLL